MFDKQRGSPTLFIEFQTPRWVLLFGRVLSTVTSRNVPKTFGILLKTRDFFRSSGEEYLKRISEEKNIWGEVSEEYRVRFAKGLASSRRKPTVLEAPFSSSRRKLRDVEIARRPNWSLELVFKLEHPEFQLPSSNFGVG